MCIYHSECITLMKTSYMYVSLGLVIFQKIEIKDTVVACIFVLFQIVVRLFGFIFFNLHTK